MVEKGQNVEHVVYDKQMRRKKRKWNETNEVSPDFVVHTFF